MSDSPHDAEIVLHSYVAGDGQRHAAAPEVVAAIGRALGSLPRDLGHTQTIQKCHAPSPLPRQWGVFIPLYALHSGRSWGAGDFSDLETLIEWVADLGGSVVGTLPLFATFPEESPWPSPYRPASRLFWNELFVDPERIPEFSTTPEARRLLDSAEFKNNRARQRMNPLVDYGEEFRVKQAVLQLLAQSFFSGSGARREAFDQFVRTQPRLSEYARFRAVGQRFGLSWRTWPEALQAGKVTTQDYDAHVARYHEYAQWVTAEQFQAVCDRGRSCGVSLYLDFPLGVHPDSFDGWRFRELFVEGVSVGAPPDRFFSQGQDWGFLPPHPLKIENHSYLPEALQNTMRYADMLRIDHVMALHRLFWVPHGFRAADGTYVRYPARPLYNLLAAHSESSRTIVIGEDLGTVPPEVRPAMTEHGLWRTCLLPYEDDVNAIPPASVVSLNTHDTPPFAALWKDRSTASGKLEQALKQMAESAASLVLINLEDLWLEDRPQNVPGTTDEHPNWRRKARYSLDEFTHRPGIVELLRKVDAWRRGKSRL